MPSLLIYRQILFTTLNQENGCINVGLLLRSIVNKRSLISVGAKETNLSQINAVSFRKREKNPSHTETGSQILCAFNHYRAFSHLSQEVTFNM